MINVIYTKKELRLNFTHQYFIHIKKYSVKKTKLKRTP